MQASTLNKIISEIKAFASAHQQIHNFGVGDTNSFASSGDVRYPALWLEYGDTDVDNVNMGGSQYTTTLTCYVSDRLQKGSFNEQDVRSDLEQIAIDLVAYLSNSNVFTWLIDSSIRLNNFGIEFHDDELAGYWFELNFRQPFIKDRCAIPFSSDPTPSGANDYLVRILDQDGNLIATVQPNSSYTITVLTGINGGTASSTYSNSIVGGLSV